VPKSIHREADHGGHTPKKVGIGGHTLKKVGIGGNTLKEEQADLADTRANTM
jgi:hypothetical protein